MCRDPFRRRERSPDRRSSSPPSQHPRRRRDFYRDYDFPSPHHSRRRCTSVRAKPLEKMSSPLLSNDKRSAAQREELSRRAVSDSLRSRHVHQHCLVNVPARGRGSTAGGHATPALPRGINVLNSGDLALVTGSPLPAPPKISLYICLQLLPQPQ